MRILFTQFTCCVRFWCFSSWNYFFFSSSLLIHSTAPTMSVRHDFNVRFSASACIEFMFFFEIYLFFIFVCVYVLCMCGCGVCKRSSLRRWNWRRERCWWRHLKNVYDLSSVSMLCTFEKICCRIRRVFVFVQNKAGTKKIYRYIASSLFFFPNAKSNNAR